MKLILDKSLPKQFYEGVIYRTAESIREKDKKYRKPSRFDNKLISSNLYVYATKEIFALFKKDPDHYWDLRSIQRELDFPGDEWALDDSEIQFLLNTLVNYGYIVATDRGNRFDPERSLYYRLAYYYHYKPTPWYVENSEEILWGGILFCYIGYCIIRRYQ